MPRGTFTPWQYLPPYGMGAPGNANTAGGGGGLGPFFRDALDAKRSMYNQTPEASWPDGYLGTINTRRGDRLLDSLKNRQNQRSYQRGVHKGERIDPADYMWPQELQPTDGITRQGMEAMPFDTMMLSPRYAPKVEMLPSYDPAYEVKQQVMWGADPGIGRTTQLKKLAPPWR
jgi:hypothetical protein